MRRRWLWFVLLGGLGRSFLGRLFHRVLRLERLVRRLRGSLVRIWCVDPLWLVRGLVERIVHELGRRMLVGLGWSLYVWLRCRIIW
jgi:hypothetical protein